MIKNQIYCMGDGDNIRKDIESLLFAQKFDELSQFSQNLINAMESLKTLAESLLNAKIVYVPIPLKMTADSADRDRFAHPDLTGVVFLL